MKDNPTVGGNGGWEGEEAQFKGVKGLSFDEFKKRIIEKDPTVGWNVEPYKEVRKKLQRIWRKEIEEDILRLSQMVETLAS